MAATVLDATLEAMNKILQQQSQQDNVLIQVVAAQAAIIQALMMLSKQVEDIHSVLVGKREGM